MSHNNSDPSLSTDEVQKRLEKQLNATTRAFHDANIGMIGVTDQLKQCPALVSLTIQWENLSTTLKDLQPDARQNASKLNDLLERMSSKILFYVDTWKDRKHLIEAVNHFSAELYQPEEEALQFTQKFSDIQRLAAGFVPQLKQFAYEQGLQISGLEAEIGRLKEKKSTDETSIKDKEDQISTLNKTISALESQIDDLRNGNYEHHTWCYDQDPKTEIFKLKGELSGYESERSTYENEVSQLRSDIQTISVKITNDTKKIYTAQTNQTAAQDVQPMVESIANSQVAQIVQDIPVLYQIWEGLNSDTNAILRYLDDPSAVPIVFKIYKERDFVYDIIRSALENFNIIPTKH